MENDNRREENNEVTGNIGNDENAELQERGSGNQYQLVSKSPNYKSTRNEQYNRKPSRSRSRSRSKPLRRKQWRSANAFLNFMQDFRQDKIRRIITNKDTVRIITNNYTVKLQDYNKVKSKDLFRLGGQKWRQMSSTEKMPYVEAAKLAQQQSQQNNKSEQTNNKPTGGDVSKKSDNEQKKKEREKRNERKRSRSKTYDSDVESDTATSGTGATMTSEDNSDLSS